MEFILDIMREMRLPLHKVLQTMKKNRKTPKYRKQWNELRRFNKKEISSAGEKDGGFPDSDWVDIIEEKGVQKYHNILHSELEELRKTPSLGLHKTGADNDIVKFTATAAKEVQEHAPSWLQLFRSTTTFHNKVDNPDEQHPKVVLILAILSRELGRRKSDYLQTILDKHFYGAGLRVRAIEILNPLGITISYRTLRQAYKDELKKNSQEIATTNQEATVILPQATVNPLNTGG